MLLEEIPALEARQMLKEHGSMLEPDQARELTLLATGDEKQAEEAWTAAAERMLDRDSPD